MNRGDWHRKANLFVVLYLFAALVAGLVSTRKSNDGITWLTVHILLLGAITNGILTWSEHFSGALLWTRDQSSSRQMKVVLFLNLGIIGVLIGKSIENTILISLSAILVALIVTFYLRRVSLLISQSLNKKFVGVIRFYQVAGIAFVLGILLGTIGAFQSDDDPWQPRIALAHLHMNLMGWVGITMIGTLVTLWPTVLRAQMHPKSLPSAVLGLKLLAVGLISAVIAELMEWHAVLALGNLIYLLGCLITLFPAAALIKKKLPDRASSWMIASGVAGLAIILIIDAIVTLRGSSSEEILKSIENNILVLFTLWLLPIFLGALMYLLPVVLGHGPKVNRELEGIINFGWKWRILLLPISSFLYLSSPRFRSLGLALAALALGTFVVLALSTIRRSKRLSSKIEDGN